MVSSEEWDSWYNPNETQYDDVDDEILHELLKKGCSGVLEGKEFEDLKILLLEQSIEDRHKSQYRARHSIYPSDEKSNLGAKFSKYHFDFGLREGEKCKVGVVLKDKVRINNEGNNKLSFNFCNIPIPSPNIKLTFSPSSGVIKKGASLEILVEMVVLCTTKVRELIAVDISNAGRYIFTIKIDSKMSQVLDYKELEMGNVIGGGGYGAIYKAKWRGLSVAVKVISELSDGSEFEKELEMHKELLHHPNIVHFVGFCVSPKCLVLEYIEGGSLDKYLHNPQYSFSPQLRLKMAYDIARGMCFLHRNEILHLDLKPQNFLVVSLSQDAPVSIKIADFGLATSSSRSFYGPTVEGSFLYMSPEVFTQKKFSRAADVWSYGACLIEILTNKRPYQEYDQLGYLELAKVREESLAPFIPQEIEGDMKKIIEACLHKDHTKRPSFENIEAFLQHKTETLFSSSPSTSISPSPVGFSESPGGSTLLAKDASFIISNLKTQQQNSPPPPPPQQNKPTFINNGTPPRKPTTIPPPIPSSPNSSASSSTSSSPSFSSSPSLSSLSSSPSFRPMVPLRVGLSNPNLLLNHNSNGHNSSSNGSSNMIVKEPIINKISRAMTDVSVSSENHKIELPARSVTVSQSSFIKPNVNHRPLPIPPLKDSNDSNEDSTSSEVAGSAIITKPKPISTSSSSTPQLAISSTTHKPPIRASSSIDIKNSVSLSSSSSSSSSTPPILGIGSTNKTVISLSSSSDLFSTSPRTFDLLKEENSEDLSKIIELRLRTLKCLKSIYSSFLDSIKTFSEIKTLNQCIELGQKVRDFKKEIELSCIEHLKMGWETIHQITKKSNPKPHLSITPSPHPSNFDGETYNKVVLFRDAAVIVGESALDGIYYLILLLVPGHSNLVSALNIEVSSSDKLPEKDLLVKVAKIARALK